MEESGVGHVAFGLRAKRLPEEFVVQMTATVELDLLLERQPLVEIASLGSFGLLL